jgi:hypothetical protein
VPGHRVWIVQCLCPSRHAILALAVEVKVGITSPQKAIEDLRDMATGLIRHGEINPWCGICHSREWTYEAAPTRFATIEEAKPHLEELERRNILAAQLLGELPW